MLPYTRCILPTAPVDVCTIVGKYDYFVDVKWHKPVPGQILRVLHTRTNYLNLLRSCVADGVHTEMQRLLVDWDANALSRDHEPQVYRLSPEKCQIQPYLKSCSLVSNLVCFIEDSVEKLAVNYLAWIKSCDRITEEPVRPTACIVLCGSQLDEGQEELARQFLVHCTTTEDRAAIYAVGYRCFVDTKMLYISRLSRKKERTRVDWALLEMVQQHTLGTGNSHLVSLGYYWQEQTAQRILSSSLAFFTERTDARLFSIAQALSAKVPVFGATLQHQKAFIASVHSLNQQGDPAKTIASLLGGYLAYHVLAHCPLLVRENFKMDPTLSEGLFDFLFRRRYQQFAEQMLECFSAELPVSLDSLKSGTHAAIDQYLGAGECITQTHLSSLGKFCDIFQRQNLQRLCAGCFFACWDDVLPCRHGFCKTCTHNYSYQWKQSAGLQFSHCPACLKSFPKPFNVRLQPPTAGGRVLSLDGGGVKGIVELEILKQLGVIVGGNIPMDRLFDMVVGTSIGGIVALGISVSRWDLDLCKEKFIALVTQVFSSKIAAPTWMKGYLGRALKYVKYAAYIALQQSLVGGHGIQSACFREFGSKGSMMFQEQVEEAPIRVAVTTCNTRDAACSIITSYNRPPLAQPRPYKWLQENDEQLAVQVWEAARCTAAVPFLFPAAQLQKERYHDGALAYNNPTILAIAEAKLFWSPTDAHNLVLSVGCGVTRESHNERHGPVFSCAHSFKESMSAIKQDRELLLGGYRFTRLDPALDVEVASLDDFEAIPQLQQSFSNMLRHNVAFSELLHSAAFELLSSIFYFEIVSPAPVFRPRSKEFSVMGVIRPRLPSNCLQHLYRHSIFHPLHFRINGKLSSFSMPKKVSLRVRDLDSPLEIELTGNAHRVRISGLPRSVNELMQLQEGFYRRCGSQKRRLTLPRDSSNPEPTRVTRTKACGRTPEPHHALQYALM